MKRIIGIWILLVGLSANAYAQNIKQLDKLVPTGTGNVEVQKLFGDSLSTSFFISIADSVALHYHEWHSEHVYIIAGKAKLILGLDTIPIASGDYFFIPAGTRHGVWNTGQEPLRVLSIQSPEFDGNDRILVR